MGDGRTFSEADYDANTILVMGLKTFNFSAHR